MSFPTRPPAQSGIALVVALLMLASITLLSMASINASVTSMRVAGIIEENVNAFQTAQAAIDTVVSNPAANLPATGPLNTPQNVALGGPLFATAAGETITASAARTLDCANPPRLSAGTSLMAYSAFTYRTAADIDRTATGRGRSSLRQGFLILGPKC